MNFSRPEIDTLGPASRTVNRVMLSDMKMMESISEEEMDVPEIEDDEVDSVDLQENFESDLLPARNKKSAVWVYFGYRRGQDGKPEDVERATCKKCKKQFWAKGGNTSNLFKHLEVNHPEEYGKIKSSTSKGKGTSTVPQPVHERSTGKQVTLTSFSKYNREEKKWKTLTDKVTFCLAKDIMPIYSVEKRGFKEMLQAFDQRYELPSRKYFSQTAIPKLYNKTRDGVKESIQKEMIFFAATSDLWSSRNMDPYMSFSVHYIDREWKLKTHCLETIFLPEDHIAPNLADALRDIMQDWDLPTDKLVAVTTDNAGNIKNAVTQLGITHVSCFGHNLNLAVNKSWKNEPRTTRAVSVCKSIVSQFSHSWHKRRDLAKYQEELGLKTKALITVSIIDQFACNHYLSDRTCMAHLLGTHLVSHLMFLVCRLGETL